MAIFLYLMAVVTFSKEIYETFESDPVYFESTSTDGVASFGGGQATFNGNEAWVRMSEIWENTGKLIIEGEIVKAEKCSDQAVGITIGMNHPAFFWASHANEVKISWECDDKFIVGQTKNVRVSCPDERTYTFKITITPTNILFEDDHCDSIELAETIFSGDVWIWFGADSDSSSTAGGDVWNWIRVSDGLTNSGILTGTPTLSPTRPPTPYPTRIPTPSPTLTPTQIPSMTPTKIPSMAPTKPPTTVPTVSPTGPPSPVPTTPPTQRPTELPTQIPTYKPTYNPSLNPSGTPTSDPSTTPTKNPTIKPTETPSTLPSPIPTNNPSILPTLSPTTLPSPIPTVSPTQIPTKNPARDPTDKPIIIFTASPTNLPSTLPTITPTPGNAPDLCEDQFLWCYRMQSNCQSAEELHEFCPLSCGLCENSTLVPTREPTLATPCEDLLPFCANYTNICDEVDYRLYCPFTCGECITERPTSMPTTAPTENCADALDQMESVIDYMISYVFCLKNEEDRESCSGSYPSK